MNDMQKEGVQERLPQFCAPIFPKCDSIDRLFAVIYLLVGYAFIYACSSYTFEQNLALFTVFYGAVVLAYLWGKEIRPSKELVLAGRDAVHWSSLRVLEYGASPAGSSADGGRCLLDAVCIRTADERWPDFPMGYL